MIRFLGWLNISLLVIMVLPFLLRQFHMRIRASGANGTQGL